jgi:hypothetical protein
VAIDGSKFKAVNTRDKNFTKGKIERRRQQLEDSVARIWRSWTRRISQSRPKRWPPRPSI